MAVLKAILIRGLMSLGVLFGVSVLIFSMARIIPGDPAAIALGSTASAEQVEQLRVEMNLDKPLPVQYGIFLANVLKGDLGKSLYSQRPVMTDLNQFLPATLELVFVSAIIMIVCGVALGILAARYRDTWIDNVIRVLSLSGIVTPAFVWAVVLMLVFSYWLAVLPVAGRLSLGVAPPTHITGLYIVDALLTGNWAVALDAFRHLILPATALALSSVSQTARLVRGSLIEIYGTPYIETAQAYGLSEHLISTSYALRPAMIPAMTVMGLDFAAKLGNAFLVEAVYAWPGLARYGVQTILQKDLNAIVGVVLVISTFFLIVNIVVDLLVLLLNPKIRLQKRTPA
jgi:peptide/nickel transport system permease protein